VVLQRGASAIRIEPKAVRFTDAEYMTVNSPIEIRGEEKVPPRLAPKVGQHSEQVLREAGYDASEIAALREAGVIG